MNHNGTGKSFVTFILTTGLHVVLTSRIARGAGKNRVLFLSSQRRYKSVQNSLWSPDWEWLTTLSYVTCLTLLQYVAGVQSCHKVLQDISLYCFGDQGTPSV